MIDVPNTKGVAPLRVFVSYSSADQPAVHDLVANLTGADGNITCFFAPRQMVGGSYWLPQLGEELARSDAILLALGKTVGPWQELEYFEALRRNRGTQRPRIVPILLGQTKPGLPFLEQFHTIAAVDVEPGRLLAALRPHKSGTDKLTNAAWRYTNPYQGLRAYTSQDAAYFHGRNDLIGAVIDALSNQRPEVLVLVGNSGVGKSSLVLAGVISAIRSQVRPDDPEALWPPTLTDSCRWQPVICRPHRWPLKSMALGFTSLWHRDAAAADAEANVWVQNFCAGSTLADLVRLARDRLSDEDSAAGPSRFFLYVDQLEELYARSEPEQARKFAARLVEAASLPDLVPLATIRSDYYGQLQADRAFFKITKRLDVPPFDKAALEQVIRAPAEQLGARFDTPEIASLIAETAEDEPGALPLLSFLLTEAWDRMLDSGDGVLRLARDVLDLSGPLINRADAFFDAFPEHRETVKRLITQRLVHLPKDGEIVRRRASKHDLTEAEWQIATMLASPDWRLLTLGEDAGVPAVDIAHETLLRAWPRAAQWIEAEREFLIWRNTLESARQTWEAAAPETRDEAALMGLALAMAEKWQASHGDALSEADHAFIAQSVALERTRKQAERARAEALAAEQETSRRRATWIARIASAAAIILLGFGSWALLERQRAEDALISAVEAEGRAEANAVEATQQQRIAEAGVARYFATEAATLDPNVHSARSILLGVEGARLDYTSQTDAALRRAIGRNQWQPLAGHFGRVMGVSLHSDGTRMASAGQDGTVRLWRLDDPARPHQVLYRGSETVFAVRIAGNHLVAVVGGKALVWALDDPSAPPLAFEQAETGHFILALSADGTRVFLGSGAKGALWSVDDPTNPIREFAHPVTIRAAAFGPDGARLAIAGSNQIALWDLASPDAAPTAIEADQREVYAIAISGDGSTLATVGFDPISFVFASTWKLNDLESGSRKTRAENSPTELIYTTSSMIIGRDGSQLLVGSNDGTVRRWLPEQPDENGILFTAEHEIEAVAIASRRWLAAADAGGLIHLYDMTGGGQEPRFFKSSGSPSFATDISPDGTHLVTADSNGAVYRQPLAFPEREPDEIFTADSDVRDVAHSPDGRWLALGHNTGRITLLDLIADGTPPRSLDLAEGVVLSMRFNAAGDRLVAGDNHGFIEVVPQTGELLRRVKEGRVHAFRFTEDGDLWTLTQNGDFRVWPADGSDPTTPKGFTTETDTPFQNAAFSPDGQLLAISHSNSIVHLYDLSRPDAGPRWLDTGFRASTMSVFGYPVAFSPGGEWLAFASGNGSRWLWRTQDLDAPPIELARGENNEVDLVFSPDSARLVTGGGFSMAPRLWSLKDLLIARGCERAGRNLSVAEWQSYWGEKPYQRTCREWPLPQGLIREEGAQFLDHRDARRVLDALNRHWLAGLPEGSSVPSATETYHRKVIADWFVARALSAFSKSWDTPPDPQQGLAYFDAAQQILPGFDLEQANIGAYGWNLVCWGAALWGDVADLLWACDLAVARGTGETLAHSRDSRGVARAVLGDLDGAKEDFAAFVRFFEGNGNYTRHVEKRRAWLDMLEIGENPMTNGTLEELRQE